MATTRGTGHVWRPPMQGAGARLLGDGGNHHPPPRLSESNQGVIGRLEGLSAESVRRYGREAVRRPLLPGTAFVGEARIGGQVSASSPWVREGEARRPAARSPGPLTPSPCGRSFLRVARVGYWRQNQPFHPRDLVFPPRVFAHGMRAASGVSRSMRCGREGRSNEERGH
jgi:hypothetical protein